MGNKEQMVKIHQHAMKNQKKVLIGRAYKWILCNMPKYVKADQLDVFINNEDMANDFKRAMGNSMKMYIARDENGCLKLFDKKPIKVLPSYDRSGYVWTVPRGYINHITLDKRLYPEVTFENSPMEVELVIKK